MEEEEEEELPSRARGKRQQRREEREGAAAPTGPRPMSSPRERTEHRRMRRGRGARTKTSGRNGTRKWHSTRDGNVGKAPTWQVRSWSSTRRFLPMSHRCFEHGAHASPLVCFHHNF